MILLNDGSAILLNDGSSLGPNPVLASVVLNRCAGGGHCTMRATGGPRTEQFDVDYADMTAPSVEPDRWDKLRADQAKLFDDVRGVISDAKAATWTEIKATVEGETYELIDKTP